MMVREGAWYITERGRVVGPLRDMTHSVRETYQHESYFEPGLWDRFGRCDHPETKTAYSYGNLVSETVQPEGETIE